METYEDRDFGEERAYRHACTLYAHFDLRWSTAYPSLLWVGETKITRCYASCACRQGTLIVLVVLFRPISDHPVAASQGVRHESLSSCFGLFHQDDHHGIQKGNQKS